MTEDRDLPGRPGHGVSRARESATSALARALAWRFEDANETLVSTLERCEAEQWRAICKDPGWTVGVQAHHVATGEEAVARAVQDVANGHPHPPMPPGMLDAINARHAEEFANVTRDETVALFRRNGAMASQAYRILSDEQLARSATLQAGGRPKSVVQIVEDLAIGEIERHGEFIRSAISRVDRSE